MSSRVSIWLTDDEFAELEARAQEMDMKPWELSILLVCRWLGAGVPSKPKARRRWLKTHEAETRTEFADRGLGTKHRVANALKLQDRPLSTKEIQTYLGWRNPGSLSELLREDEDFERVPAPPDYKRKRGRQPTFWRLVKEKRDEGPER